LLEKNPGLRAEEDFRVKTRLDLWMDRLVDQENGMFDRGSSRVGWVMVLATLLLSVGCESLDKIGTENRPTAKIVGARLAGVNTEAANLVFDVDVSNPYAFPLPLTNLDFALATQGAPFVTGTARSQGEVPAKGKKRIAVPVSTRFSELFAVAQGVKPGQVVPYVANFNFTAEAPAIGTVSLPVTHSGELPIPTSPQVELKQIRWDALSIEEARATMLIRVVNRNAFPIEINRVGYTLELGGIHILDTGIGSGAKFEANGEQTLEAPLTFSPKRLGAVGFQMLGGRGAGYRFAGTVNASTPQGPIDMPFEKKGETVFRR
jgi:LEA14-like dessication related protein